MFRINIDKKENLDVMKFKLPQDFIQKYCWQDCQLFATLFTIKVGGEIKLISDDHFVVFYNNYYIDVYGIHTEEALLYRKLPMKIPNGKIILAMSYFEQSTFTIDDVKMKNESELIELIEYHGPVKIELTEFIIDMIVDMDIFKNFFN